MFAQALGGKGLDFGKDLLGGGLNTGHAQELFAARDLLYVFEKIDFFIGGQIRPFPGGPGNKKTADTGI